MDAVNIFDTYAEADSLLKQYLKSNQEAREKMDKLAEVMSLNTDRSKLGEGLELICALELEADDTEDQIRYIFNATIFSPDNDNEYYSIPDLARGADEYLKRQNNSCLGARVSPFFYTVRERQELTEEQKSQLRASLDELERLGTTPREKKWLEILFKQTNNLKPYRNLTLEERQEFEALYNQG